MPSLMELNGLISYKKAPFMILGRVLSTNEKATFCGRAGYYKLGPKESVTIWVDDYLNRYARHSSGQLFECSNADLLSMGRFAKAIFLYHLSSETK